MIESPRQVGGDLASSTQVLDEQERDLIDTFINKGCGCKLGCSSYFNNEYYTKNRNECAELTHKELDLFLMGNVSATVIDSMDAGVMSRHKPHPRQRPKTFFQHHSYKVFSNTQVIKLEVLLLFLVVSGNLFVPTWNRVLQAECIEETPVREGHHP